MSDLMSKVASLVQRAKGALEKDASKVLGIIAGPHFQEIKQILADVVSVVSDLASGNEGAVIALVESEIAKAIASLTAQGRLLPAQVSTAVPVAGTGINPGG